MSVLDWNDMMKRDRCKQNSFALIALLSAQGCAYNPVGTRAEQEEDMREAVLLHLIHSKKQPSVVFIRVNNTDPSPRFLQRFSGYGFTAKPVSQSSWRNGSVIDPLSGKWSRIYEVSKVSWIDTKSAEVEGGYKYEGGTYLVNWSGTQWQVVKSTINYIS
jgi:hypothetical protein